MRRVPRPELRRAELEEHARAFVRIGGLLDRAAEIRDRRVGDALRERARSGLAKRLDDERVARGLAEQEVRRDALGEPTGLGDDVGGVAV